ncbi:virulence factor TspB C-terminal domain-related protein [Acinetobacter gyllenbergii]|uniref:virulence factor TspB C-terminal domain-related protein n=1 Tax=Acinetobacter gyllenbergii TaxID=134534 RepID=UPI003AF83019
MPTKELDVGEINTSLFKVTSQCPAPIQWYVPVVNRSFSIDLSKLCEVLAIIGILISIAAMIHGIAIIVENS